MVRLQADTTTLQATQPCLIINGKHTLLTSDDVEQNPGPRQRAQTTPSIPKPPPKRKQKFLCSICERAVTWSRTKPSVACDDCNTWYQKSCLDMSSQIFQGIRPDTPWQCDKCGIQNFMNSTLFYHPEVPLANRYSVLSEPDQLDDEPGSPLHTSSTKAAQNLPKDIPPIKNTLRILVVDTQSIFKRHTLALTTESISPDIIVATETQLTGTTTNPEFLPPDYHKYLEQTEMRTSAMVTAEPLSHLKTR